MKADNATANMRARNIFVGLMIGISGRIKICLLVMLVASSLTISVKSDAKGAGAHTPPGKPLGYLYCGSSDRSGPPTITRIYQYRIQPDGRLSALSPPFISTTSDPVPMVSDKGGRFLYVGSETGQRGQPGISIYHISDNGCLKPHPATVTLPYSALQSLAISPSGKFLYAVLQTKIVLLRIEPDGMLVVQKKARLQTDPYLDLFDIAFDLAGRYAFVNSYNIGIPSGMAGSVIQQFKVSAQGDLTPNNPPDFLDPATHDKWLTTNGPIYRLLHRQVFYIDSDSGVDTFTLSKSGTLEELPPLKIYGVTVTSDPTGSNAYMYTSGEILISHIKEDGTLTDPITQLIASDGTLALMPPAVPNPKSYLDVTGLVIDPSGKYAYICGGPAGLLAYSIAVDGNLVLVQRAPGVVIPWPESLAYVKGRS